MYIRRGLKQIVKLFAILLIKSIRLFIEPRIKANIQNVLFVGIMVYLNKIAYIASKKSTINPRKTTKCSK